MKQIYITGIAGFIGFHLALALKKRGDAVFGCDNFNAYYDPTLKKERSQLLKSAGIEVLCCDVTQKEVMAAELARHKITHVVHLAAQAGVRHSIEHPESYVHSNLDGFVQVLEAIKSFPGIAFTYASSSSVYGMNKKIPFSESDPVELPASFYGATKRCNELIAHCYHHIHNIPCTGLRFFTVYGPWGRPDMAYYFFSKAILEGNTIPVFGEGKLMRDFTYVDDIVDGVIAAIDLEAKNELFNLGNNAPVTILEFIQILEKHLGKKALIDFQPMPPGDVPMTYADISKSQKLLGFQPKMGLDEGLKRFIDWYAAKQGLVALSSQ
jgi:UDP-glucuronate 4-epimerase